MSLNPKVVFSLTRDYLRKWHWKLRMRSNSKAVLSQTRSRDKYLSYMDDAMPPDLPEIRFRGSASSVPPKEMCESTFVG